MLWCDNTGTISVVANLIQHAKMKHIELYLFFVRGNVSKGIVKVNHIPGSYQIADALTKLLTEKFFIRIRRKLGVCSLCEALSDGSRVSAPFPYLASTHHFFSYDVLSQVSSNFC